MGLDRLIFGAMYRLGFTPWDGHQLPPLLLELVEGPTALPKGKALDIGCGTGDTSIYLAKNGWDATAVDFVERALDRARTKTSAAGLKVRYIRADATKLRSFDVGSGFQLAIDNGCMHGLSDEGRDAYVKELTAVVAPGGRFVLGGFREGKRRGPRGFDRPEIERRFASGWELRGVSENQMVSNLPDDPIYIYDLRRRIGN